MSESSKSFVEVKERNWVVYIGIFYNSNSCSIKDKGIMENKTFDRPVVAEFRANTELLEGCEKLLENENFLDFNLIQTHLSLFLQRSIETENFIEYLTGSIFFGVNQIFSHFNLKENEAYYETCLNICLRLIDSLLILFEIPSIKFIEKGNKNQQNEYNKGWQEITSLLDLLLSDPQNIMDYRTCENLELLEKNIKNYWNQVDPNHAYQIISNHLQIKSCIRFFYSIKPLFAKLQYRENLVTPFLNYLKDNQLDLKKYDQKKTVEIFNIFNSNNNQENFSIFLNALLKILIRSEKLIQQREILLFVEENHQYLKSFEDAEKVLRTCFSHESLPKLAKNLITQLFRNIPEQLIKIGEIIKDEIIFIEFLEFLLGFLEKFENFQDFDYRGMINRLEKIESKSKEEFIERFVGIVLRKYGAKKTVKLLGNPRLVVNGLLFNYHYLEEIAFIRNYTGSNKKSKTSLDVLSDFVKKCENGPLKEIDSKTNVLFSLLFQINKFENFDKDLIKKIIENCNKERLVCYMNQLEPKINRIISSEMMSGKFDDYSLIFYNLLKAMKHPRLDVLSYMFKLNHGDFNEFIHLLNMFLVANPKKRSNKISLFLIEYISKSNENKQNVFHHLNHIIQYNQYKIENLNDLIEEGIRYNISLTMHNKTSSAGFINDKLDSYLILFPDEIIKLIKTSEFYEAAAKLTQSNLLYTFSLNETLIYNLLSLRSIPQLIVKDTGNKTEKLYKDIYQKFNPYIYIPIVSQYLIEIIGDNNIIEDYDRMMFNCICTISKASDKELNLKLNTREIIMKRNCNINQKSDLENYLTVALDFTGNQIIDSSIFYSDKVLLFETHLEPDSQIAQIMNKELFDTLKINFFENLMKYLENDKIIYLFELLANPDYDPFLIPQLENTIKNIEAYSELYQINTKPIINNIIKFVESIETLHLKTEFDLSITFKWIFDMKLFKNEETLLRAFRVYFNSLKTRKNKSITKIKTLNKEIIKNEKVRFTEYSSSFFQNLAVSHRINYKSFISTYTLSEKGLINLGNTCYINSVIQLLNRIKPLVRLILEKENQNKEIILLKTLLIEMNYSIQALANIKEFVTNYTFNGEKINCIQQQDADDFFKSLFQKLEEAFGSELKSFQTSILNSYQCLSCETEIKKQYEDFFIVNLDIFENSTISKSFDKFLSSKKTDQVCQECKKPLKILRTIEKLPEFLGITLNRFSFNSDSYSTSKNYEKCKITDTITLNKKIYILDSFIVHIGNSQSGHYVAFVKSQENGWVLCNDENISFYPQNQFKFDDLNSLNKTLFSNNEKSTPYIFLYKIKEADTSLHLLKNIQEDLKVIKINNDYFYNIFLFFQPKLIDIVPAKDFERFFVDYVFNVGVYLDNCIEILEKFKREEMITSITFTNFLKYNNQIINIAIVCIVNDSAKNMIYEIILEKMKLIEDNDCLSYLYESLKFLNCYPHNYIDLTIIVKILIQILSIKKFNEDIKNDVIKNLIKFNANPPANQAHPVLITNTMQPTNFNYLYKFIDEHIGSLDIKEVIYTNIKELANQLRSFDNHKYFSNLLCSICLKNPEMIKFFIEILNDNKFFYFLLTFISKLPKVEAENMYRLVYSTVYRFFDTNYNEIIKIINDFRNCDNIRKYIENLHSFINNIPSNYLPAEKEVEYLNFLKFVLQQIPIN